MTAIFRDYAGRADQAARRLLGQRLVRIRQGERLSGRIVEVEAYLGAKDKAAHSYGGRKTARNASMYLPGGTAYVYFVYGMHHCFNIVCGRTGDATAVLIRALEPLEGMETMQSLRPTSRRTSDLCSGPGRLTKALDIDKSLDGVRLARASGIYVERDLAAALPRRHITITPRIGVAYAEDWAKKPLRFYLTGNPCVSGGRRKNHP